MANGVSQDLSFYDNQLAARVQLAANEAAEHVPSKELTAAEMEQQLSVYKKAWKTVHAAARILSYFDDTESSSLQGRCCETAQGFIKSVEPFKGTEIPYSIFDMHRNSAIGGWSRYCVSTQISDLTDVLVRQWTDLKSASYPPYQPKEYKQWRPLALELIKALENIPGRFDEKNLIKM